MSSKLVSSWRQSLFYLICVHGLRAFLADEHVLDVEDRTHAAAALCFHVNEIANIVLKQNDKKIK